MQRKLRYGRFATLVSLILLLALAISPGFATADDELAAYREDLKRISEERKQNEKTLESSKSQKSEVQRQVAALDIEQSALAQEIAAAETVIGSLNVQIDEATVDIANATERLNERQAYLESRLRDIYINGDITMLDVFFSAASFDEFIVLYDMVERIMAQDKEVLDDITAQRALIEEEKARLQKLKADQEAVLAEMAAKATELKRIHDQKAKAMNELTMTIAEAEAQQVILEEDEKLLQDTIRQILASRAKVAYYGGAFIWPLPDTHTNITSEYGMRNHPILKKNIMHAGIDIGAPNGIPIYAVTEGEVIYHDWLGGYGQAVMVDHGGGVVTLYGHMSQLGSFGKGVKVVTGDVIGYVGSTGQSTGNHLHFEVRINGSHTDPHPYLGR